MFPPVLWIRIYLFRIRILELRIQILIRDGSHRDKFGESLENLPWTFKICGVEAQNGALWRVCRPVIVDSHRLDEEQNPDPDPQ
jgi:hypothetical protein